MDQAFYGLSINGVRTMVFEYCEKNNISNGFHCDTKMAGPDFVTGFRKRHPRLSLRKPEAVFRALTLQHIRNVQKIHQFY